MGCQHNKSIVTDQQVPSKTTREEFIVSGKLTEFEQDVIHSTWPLISNDLCENGGSVLINVFQTYPKIKQIFNFRNVPDEDLFYNPDFRRHSSQYMQIIGDAVTNLTDLPGSGVCDRLMVLGARHAALPGFQFEYFKMMARSTLNTWEAILGEEYTEEVREVWTVLLDYITNAMVEGCIIYNEEGQSRATSICSVDPRSSSVRDPNQRIS